MHGGAVGVGLPEGVVEDLERQRAVVAGGQDMGDEAGQVEGALAGEQPVMAAPREHVHVQRGRVGELEEEDLVGGDVLDRSGVVAARQHVETVQADPDVRVVGELDDAPGAAVVVDEPAPRQRLERHLDVVLRGQVAEAAQLVGRHLVVVDVAVATLLHTSTMPMPSRCAVANVAPARRRLSAKVVSSTPSMSRNGWYRSSDRPSRLLSARISSGLWSLAIRSGSKSSTPSKPAAAQACSFSVSDPLSETVAMDVLIGSTSVMANVRNG